MKEKDLICIMCPVGCHLHVEGEEVSGNKCKRGMIYALEEMKAPKRTLTSTVRTKSLMQPRLSVKTNKPLPKELIFKAIEKLTEIIVENNVKIGDVIIKNICDSNVDIIATKSLEN